MADTLSSLPVLRITRRAADRLRSGHLWVYRTDVESATDAIAAGALVAVQDNRQAPLGAAIYSSTSQIAARVVSTDASLTREQFVADVRTRVAEALERRRIVSPLDSGTDAQRLVFAEADNLPGIVMDRYNDLVLVQLLAQGTAQDDVRSAIADALRAELAAGGEVLTVWERPDPRIRELEQLAPPPKDGLLLATGEASARTTFRLNGIQLQYDAAAGQKTGAFLDQRLNYAAAAAHVKASGRTARALDVCTYQGGFALHLAGVCESVTGVDQSRSALETADANLTLNPQLGARVDWVEADAFALLRALDDAVRGGASEDLPVSPSPAFDAIVLDPPAFAKSKRAVEGAMRGYKELNLRALRLLAPGGTLVTCSCSHHVALEDFTAVVAAAASDAGRRVQLLEVRAAAPDHPEVLTLPETRYLKCLICRVE